MEDTINLLKECDSGTKMAVASIDDVFGYAKSKRLIEILEEVKEKHEKYGNIIHEYLLELGSNDKEPNPIAKGMSKMKINFKMAVDGDDSMIADLMTDGCNMGIKSLNRYINEYPDADHKAKDMAEAIIKTEKEMINSLKGFL